MANNKIGASFYGAKERLEQLRIQHATGNLKDRDYDLKRKEALDQITLESATIGHKDTLEQLYQAGLIDAEEYGEQIGQYNEMQMRRSRREKPDILPLVLSFFLLCPFVGVVYYFKYRNEPSKPAYLYLVAGFAGLVFALILRMVANQMLLR